MLFHTYVTLDNVWSLLLSPSATQLIDRFIGYTLIQLRKKWSGKSYSVYVERSSRCCSRMFLSEPCLLVVRLWNHWKAGTKWQQRPAWQLASSAPTSFPLHCSVFADPWEVNDAFQRKPYHAAFLTIFHNCSRLVCLASGSASLGITRRQGRIKMRYKGEMEEASQWWWRNNTRFCHNFKQTRKAENT